MNSIITILISIMCGLGFSSTACVLNAPNLNSKLALYEAELKKIITFQLPDRWGIIANDWIAFASFKSPETGELYDIMMSWDYDGDNQTEEDAKSAAKSEAKLGCTGKGKYLEDTVAGKNLYIAIEKGCSKKAGSNPYESRIYFIENKHLITVVLSENYNNFKPDIEMMLKTFSMNF